VRSADEFIGQFCFGDERGHDVHLPREGRFHVTQGVFDRVKNDVVDHGHSTPTIPLMVALEKPLGDEAIEQVLAEVWIETPQPRGLRNCEREAGHFGVFTTNALERVVLLPRALAVQRRGTPFQCGGGVLSKFVDPTALDERTLPQLSGTRERSTDCSKEH
jgi:hypothetical protein